MRLQLQLEQLPHRRDQEQGAGRDRGNGKGRGFEEARGTPTRLQELTSLHL